MKSNFTRVFAVLSVAAVLLYSSCQKSSTKPSVTSTTTISDATAKQIALSIYQSLTGQMGGANVKDGAKAPSSIAPATGKNGKTLNSLTSLCGFTLDTTFGISSQVKDTSEWLSAKYLFTYTCSGNAGVDGYTLYDSIRTQYFNTTFVNDYTNVQNYVFQEVGTGYVNASVNGEIKTIISSSIYNTGEYHTLNCDYLLHQLIVTNTATGTDILSGSASFTASTHDIPAGSGANQVIINYTGTIVFEGNFEAEITIDPNHVYEINMLTKVITPK